MALSAAPLSNPTPDETRKELDRILASKSFSGSETLRNLLRYLADKSVESPDHPPKEHDVATKLLGRGVDFDPKLDPVVRVQTTRLRSKLAEYYVSEGVGERVYIEIPKGSYTIMASYRGAEPETAPPPVPEAAVAPPNRRARWFATAGIAIFVVVIAAVAWWATRPTDPDVRSFWKLFMKDRTETILVYSNPKLVGTSGTGLRMFDATRDQGTVINNGYTGAGEVMAVHALSSVFARMNGNLRPRRAQLFSWDDTRGHNVIFVGAPPHNVPLFDVQMGRSFRLKPYGQEPRADAGCFENLQPRAGEEKLYCMSAEGATQIEYALVTFARGVDRQREAVLVAGTTTFSTEAAADFITDQERMEGLHKVLGGRDWPRFEALLRCTIRSGVPVSAELVTARRP
ncbi:MAG: hypothetical protein SGI92_27635 [Bryobacteraceae bacterium]|nr:hypothetical protein [Bryobacteraceae bacterium]